MRSWRRPKNVCVGDYGYDNHSEHDEHDDETTVVIIFLCIAHSHQ